jgi:deoxyribodipyrimidine photo-lyase
VQKQQSCVIFWFRRDLRLKDNIGLYRALQSGKPVLPVFIFDEEILKPLPANDHRLAFIYDVISSMHSTLNVEGGRGVLVQKGQPLEVFKNLLEAYRVEAVYCNQDHEPYGIRRDESISGYLKEKGIGFYSFTDHLITEKGEILTAEGNPYRVFTPYSRAWKSNLQTNHTNHFSSEDYLSVVLKQKEWNFPSLASIGFQTSELKAPALKIDDEIISKYDQTRDIPSLEGTSRLGVHLRFGTISIRELVRKALKLNETFLNELIWREFYAMILWHYPRVVDEAFKPAYDRILWRDAEDEFELWKTGMTGFPMVDAGMRQLNATGYMHNRLRMVVASFLSKHLLIDWRWGEAYFAEKLFDFELSSNNGGWQWSAGTGCDAAPYFRIFNPASQQKKFDPQQRFIRQWIPEFGTDAYPEPMVDHSMARERCLSTYQKALK